MPFALIGGDHNTSIVTSKISSKFRLDTFPGTKIVIEYLEVLRILNKNINISFGI